MGLLDRVKCRRRTSGLHVPDRDGLVWRAQWSIEKRLGDWTGELIDAFPVAARRALEAFEVRFREPAVIRRSGNLLMYGGASCLWECLEGNGTATAGQALTFFNNAQAAIGVGDSSTAAAATQTNLQAASNKLRKAMDASYPDHTDGTTSGAASVIYRSTFGTSDANFAWQEWGVFNSTTDATGRMLNRKVESLGTKTSAGSWTFTVTLTLS